MSKKLYINANIYPDGIKCFENGSMMIDGPYIKDVTYKKIDNLDVEVIDLKGASIIPSFVRFIDYQDLNNLSLEDQMAIKIISFKLMDEDDFQNYKTSLNDLNLDYLGIHLIIINNDILEYHFDEITRNDKIISLSLNHTIDNSLIHKIKALKKCFVNYSNDDYFNDDFDAYFDFMNQRTTFDKHGSKMFIKGLLSNDKYINLHCDLSDELYQLIFKLTSNKKLLIKDSIKHLLNLNCDFMDIVRVTALNYYDFYGINNEYGKLVKGKLANFMIVKDGQIIEAIYKGESVND